MKDERWKMRDDKKRLIWNIIKKIEMKDEKRKKAWDDRWEKKNLPSALWFIFYALCLLSSFI